MFDLMCTITILDHVYLFGRVSLKLTFNISLLNYAFGKNVIVVLHCTRSVRIALTVSLLEYVRIKKRKNMFIYVRVNLGLVGLLYIA